MGFPIGLDSKKSSHKVGDLGLIPGLERSSGEGNGYPLQYSWIAVNTGEERIMVKKKKRTPETYIEFLRNLAKC